MLNVSYHLAQYTSIIADLRSEIERLRAKIDQEQQKGHKDIREIQGVFRICVVETQYTLFYQFQELKNLKLKCMCVFMLAGMQQYSQGEIAGLREQLLSAFREQMEIRRSLMELESCNMELHIDTSRHLLTISE